MIETEKVFLENAEHKAFDLEHRRKINFNISKYNTAVQKGLGQFSDLNLARKRANAIKYQAIEHLDRYLLEFEKNATANGVKVIWADTAEDARQEILQLMKQYKARSVVKSKSMVCEEIELNHCLEAEGIESVETDLGEYIVQLLHQKPYHIVTPAMHLSKEDIAALFHEKFNTAPDADPQTLTLKARELLRQKYVDAEIGITGANFLIADTGSIALTENEGNARLSTAFPKVHIAIAGIEKIIPSMEQLSLFWPLLATRGTGQQVTVYNSIISGPKKNTEDNGPDHMYVILLNNGRTEMLAKPESRQGLYCIRCGACLNACPVYKNIGGHAYETTYSGPIGSIITPHFQGMKDFAHLSNASSLCGNCTEVCPVHIDIHNILLFNRHQNATENHKAIEKWSWKFWRISMKSRFLVDLVNGNLKTWALSKFGAKAWGEKKAIPKFSKQSFSEQWRQKNRK
jgi:L-lactate dehydrogenase complex protein LldF